jgi:cytochrome c peroxidase
MNNIVGLISMNLDKRANMCRYCFVLLGIGMLPLTAFGQIGEQPVIADHVDQEAVDQGQLGLTELFELGQTLFDARFNRLDGQGRPATTGAGAPREPDEPDFIRTSGPDSNSCLGCHAQPRSGGAGDFVVNVFVLAQALDPVTASIEAQFSNERNTLGMMGAGPIEMLAREMSTELIAIREAAKSDATTTAQSVTRALTAKGINFGSITVLPDGKIDPSAIEGVDWDLIVKPFHQKGAVVSLREFTNNAMNHHHGMQSVERFGADTDPDQDGVLNELTVGDITAATIFQAALNTPGRVVPKQYQAEVAEGEQLFAQIGCTSCHVPSMTLQNRNFTEPNPFNPTGNLGVADVTAPFSFDLTQEGPEPRVERSGANGAIVRAFSDLKRHNLNDDDIFFFDNEQVPQGKLNGFAPESDFTIPATPRPTDQFLTRKLWDAGNTGPYGHRGDLTTLTDAIFYHGGESRESRDAFLALSQDEQDKVIEFLKSLQIVEEGADLVTIVDEDGLPDGGDNGGGVRVCGAVGGAPLLSMLMLLSLMRLAPTKKTSQR